MQIKVIFFLAFFICANLYAQEIDKKNLDMTVFKIKNVSIRAIEVVNDSILWFAGSNGKFGRIINEKIEIDSISFDDTYLNFRSIAFNGEDVFFLSIESPAILYKKNAFSSFTIRPDIVYGESHEKVFYDAMTFSDKKHGIAMGDPTHSCLSVITTNDGGNKWFKMDCENLPDIEEGEAAFAASNSNISVYNENVWLVTGGGKARVFHSPNFGKNWQVYDTPITQGGKMTGIFSVDFYDENNGIIMGGDWENKNETKASKAITRDGGKTWHLIADDQIPGYISCVQFVPNTSGKEIAAVSSEGLYYSNNSGISWTKISEEGYYSIRFVNQKTAWLSGENKISKINLN